VSDVMDGESRSPGANDNASGVAVLMETARLLSARTWQQTIVFAFLAAEEQGTFGSRHFVQDLLLDGHIIDVAINNDIVGGRPGIPQVIRVFAPGPENSEYVRVARHVPTDGGRNHPCRVRTFRTWGGRSPGRSCAAARPARPVAG
jgi:Zn-dependent M28 family amino/carboxypeptidase